jgi:hypothetical protein
LPLLSPYVFGLLVWRIAPATTRFVGCKISNTLPMISFYTRPFHPSPQRILKSTLRFKVEDMAPTIKKMLDLLDSGDESLPNHCCELPQVETSMFYCIRTHDSHFSGSSPELFLQPTGFGIVRADVCPSYPTVWNYARAFCITKLRTSFQCVSVVGEYVEGYQLR